MEAGVDSLVLDRVWWWRTGAGMVVVGGRGVVAEPDTDEDAGVERRIGVAFCLSMVTVR